MGDGIAGRGETKIAMNTDKKWHDWATGDAALAVLCAKDLSGKPNPKPEPTGKCVDGWTAVGSRCFKYDGNKRNYANSVNYCKSQGGNIATVYNNQENDALIQITKATAYIGAESDGKGNWKWIDGSKWWQPAGTQHDGIQGTGETKIAIHTDKKWHDWATGDAALSVLCAKSLDDKPKAVTGWCANSPKLLCRIACPTSMPSCKQGECASRLGTCSCAYECKSDTPKPKTNCGDGWTTVGNRCFKYDGTKRNYA